ncbi:MAG TPA: AAA family ATPase [Gemmatimonadaceae bacterium]
MSGGHPEGPRRHPEAQAQPKDLTPAPGGQVRRSAQDDGREPRRVVLIGSECTGKTTLARALAERLAVPWSAEYVREFVDALGRDPVAEDVEAIARGQVRIEEVAVTAARERRASLVVHDTDLLSTLVYTEHYYGPAAVPPWVPGTVLARRPALYLLSDIDVPWMPDPQRNRGDRREEMQSLFRLALESRGFPFVEVRGLDTDRFVMAELAIRSLLESS